jgi:hypothetical protein
LEAIQVAPSGALYATETFNRGRFYAGDPEGVKAKI